MELVHIQIEGLQRTLLVLGEKAHPMLAYRVSLLNEVIRPVIKAISAARTPAPQFQAYTKKLNLLCEACAEKNVSGKAIKNRTVNVSQTGWSDQYKIVDVEQYKTGFANLEMEYSDVLATEATRQEQLLELLESPVDLELKYNIKYSWCKELLTGNHMTRLLECGILEMDEDPEEVLGESKGDTSEEVPE